MTAQAGADQLSGRFQEDRFEGGLKGSLCSFGGASDARDIAISLRRLKP